YPNVGDLLSKIGVKVESIKSSPLKAAPDGFEPTSPEARAAIESLIKDSYAWFRGLVQTRRHLSDEELQTVADGRVFTGHQGIGLQAGGRLWGQKSRYCLARQGKEHRRQAAGPRLPAARPLPRPAVPARHGGGGFGRGRARDACPAPQRLGYHAGGGA